MSPHIFDYIEKKDNSHSNFYLGAVGIAMVVAYTLIFGIKLLTYLGKLVIENWVWAVGIILGIMIFKKVMTNRNRRPRYEYPSGEV